MDRQTMRQVELESNIMGKYIEKQEELNLDILKQKEKGELSETIFKNINEEVTVFNQENSYKILRSYVNDKTVYLGPALVYNPVEEKVDISHLFKNVDESESNENVVFLKDNRKRYIKLNPNGSICTCFTNYKTLYSILKKRLSAIDEPEQKRVV